MVSCRASSLWRPHVVMPVSVNIHVSIQQNGLDVVGKNLRSYVNLLRICSEFAFSIL